MTRYKTPYDATLSPWISEPDLEWRIGNIRGYNDALNSSQVTGLVRALAHLAHNLADPFAAKEGARALEAFYEMEVKDDHVQV